MQYAILKDGVFVEFRIFNAPPEVATHKGYTALPVVEERVDNSTQGFTSQVTEEIIEPTRYLIRTTVSDLPQGEINTIRATKKDALVTEFEADLTLTKALGLTLFDLVNEVRALKSQAPLTLQQFKDYVKGKL